MELGISTIGIMVLLVIVAVTLIVFLMYGIAQQTSILNDTHTTIIGNLSDLID